MIEIIKIDIKPSMRRIAGVTVKYHDIYLMCDLCVYKDSHLWIRMPELWISKKVKLPLVHWTSKEVSDSFQKTVLEKVYEMKKLDLEEAIRLKQEFKKNKKSTDKNKEKIYFKTQKKT